MPYNEESFMEDSAHTLMLCIFRDIPDQRMPGKVIHKPHDILVITVCAVIGGLEYWIQIEDFAKANEAWFKTFLDLLGSIPSHDTFCKVFSVISPNAFELWIQQWIHCLVGFGTRQKHIAVDGEIREKKGSASYLLTEPYMMGRGGIEPPTHEFSVGSGGIHKIRQNKALCLFYKDLHRINSIPIAV
jgi:hypothetical protein